MEINDFINIKLNKDLDSKKIFGETLRRVRRFLKVIFSLNAQYR